MRTMSSIACQTYKYSAAVGAVTRPDMVRTQCLSVSASATVSLQMTRLGTKCIKVGAIALIDTP